MNLEGKNITFRSRKPVLSPVRIFMLLAAILAGLFIIRGISTQNIEPLFLPTPYPTRTANSFATEGATQFNAGNLDAAIAAYEQALILDPSNGDLAAELARIQVYYSAIKTTDEEKRSLLESALNYINQAKELEPDNSNIRAIRSFVLDWNANTTLVTVPEADKLLMEAGQEAVAAIQFDNKNGLAMAYYAEILNSQMNWEQAEKYITQALQLSPDQMDVHRIHGTYLETTGRYSQAIDAYKRAVAITPNLSFLLIQIGVNYRQLKDYGNALAYFEQAVDINKRLQISDPIPYLALGRTYAQQGEWFSASRNVRRALELNPTKADMYGQLGVIYFKARNYEGSIPALKCAVRGCDSTESCEIRQCDSTKDPAIEIQGLPISRSTLEYYEYYSSALAGMHRDGDTNCTEARDILNQIRANFSDDPVVMKLVRDNESICFGASMVEPTAPAPSPTP